MVPWLTNWVKRSPLASYFILIFGIEWLLVLILSSLASPVVALLIGSWLPNCVGLLVTGVASGWAGLRELFSKVVLWRVGVRWYVAAILAPVGTAFVAIGLAQLLGGAPPDPAPASQLLPIALAAVFTGAMGEELGWRGTALPRLQARWNPLVSALVLGPVWGLYHLPAFFLSGLPQQNAPLVPFMVAALGITILMSWIFNRTGGSLITVFLCHCAFNFVGNATGVFGVSSVSRLWSGILLVVAIAVVALDWTRFTQSRGAPPEGVWLVR